MQEERGVGKQRRADRAHDNKYMWGRHTGAAHETRAAHETCLLLDDGEHVFEEMRSHAPPRLPHQPPPPTAAAARPRREQRAEEPPRGATRLARIPAPEEEGSYLRPRRSRGGRVAWRRAPPTARAHASGAGGARACGRAG